MVFVPVHDKNALQHIRFQIVTIGLIALNTAVFFWQSTLDPETFEAVTLGAGLTPAWLVGNGSTPQAALIPSELTLITHMFLHGSWLHLGANMVFLWVFGDNVEDAMGHVKFLAFYLVCGIGAAYTHAITEPQSDLPMIGASGATAGVIGAYLMLYPRVKVWILVLLRLPLRFPAYWVLTFWLAFQVYFIVSGTQPGTAWWAHIGGFIVGSVLVLFLRRKGVKLFGPYASAEDAATAPEA